MRRLVTEPELTAAARELGAAVRTGEIVWLEGDLGAGKTTFAKALVGALGASEPVTSPTYSLVHRYDSARGPVFHVDCYRFRHSDEARDLDWEGLSGGELLLIEWPDRAGPWSLPATRRVKLDHADDPERRWLEIV